MINGIINIYKEQGFTSHDVVAKMRGILKQKKIGHTGTLDPDATGVLLVCLGNATKLCDILIDRTKVYETELILGITTDTQDLSGKIQKTSLKIPTEAEIYAAIKQYSKDYMQIPPMYSALKVNGKKLVDLARQGIEVERKPRKVQILGIDILEVDYPRVCMRVHCGKGTYIRTLIHDIGETLECGASMKSLIRTEVSGLRVDTAITLKELEEIKNRNMLDTVVIEVERVFLSFPKLILKKEAEKLAYNGNKLKSIAIWQGLNEIRNQKGQMVQQYRVYDSRNQFLGIYDYIEHEDCLKPYKLFFT